MVETTTIYEQRQELTSTNVAGKLHMMWHDQSIQNSRVTSANMTHSTKISVVPMGWQHQGRATVAVVSKFERSFVTPKNIQRWSLQWPRDQTRNVD
jgi:hypothetical protein